MTIIKPFISKIILRNVYIGSLLVLFFASAANSTPANPPASSVKAEDLKPEEVISIPETVKDTSKNGYQEIIDEFKDYIATVPASVRKEIEDFRTQIASLDQKKRDLYKKLSIEAQKYFQKEQEFKNKLPISKPPASPNQNQSQPSKH